MSSAESSPTANTVDRSISAGAPERAPLRADAREACACSGHLTGVRSVRRITARTGCGAAWTISKLERLAFGRIAGNGATVGNPRFDLIVKRRHAIHQEHRVVHACRSGRLGSAERAYRIHVEADEQHVRPQLRARHGVLALAAAQIQHHMRERLSANRPARRPRIPASGPRGAVAANPIAAPLKTLRKREPFMQSGSSRAHAFPFRARNGFRAIYLNSPAKQTLRGCDLTCWADGAAAMPHYARVRISSHTFAMKSAVSNGCVSLERSRTAMLPSSASFSPTTII